eukprot:355576-Chlamydomonas_euryale.AAC.2
MEAAAAAAPRPATPGAPDRPHGAAGIAALTGTETPRSANSGGSAHSEPVLRADLTGELSQVWMAGGCEGGVRVAGRSSCANKGEGEGPSWFSSSMTQLTARA